MIRLLGAITGSALALATLLVLVGVPQFKAKPTGAVEVDVMTLPLPTAPVEPEPAVIVDAAPATMDTVPPPTAEPVAEPAVEPGLVAVEATDPAPMGTETTTTAMLAEPWPPVGTLDETLESASAAAELPETQWYAFWSPFRSELAASGFVSRLQSVTGLDYRVVKVKPGAYEVAFAYTQDTDITVNLSQISAATGLDLPAN
jgi:hypothetical protein